MAIIYKCDRCGREQTAKGDIYNLTVPHTTSNYGDFDTYSRDLCRNCVRDLEEWIKPLKKVEN